MSKDKLILDLCDSYRKSVVSENGITIGSNNDKYRLRNNNICFYDLNYDEIRASCIGLTRTLLYKGLNTIIDYDHFFFGHGLERVYLYGKQSILRIMNMKYVTFLVHLFAYVWLDVEHL